MARQNRATVAEMKAKHPTATHAPNFQPDISTPQMILSKDQVAKEIKSFKKGTAPGPSGLRGEHLKEAIKSTPPNRIDKATAAITNLVNCMGAGKVPGEVAPYLCGARLHAAKKNDGGIRPIAVGEIFRRLTSKGFSHAMSDRAAAILSPCQLGVGVRGGCEAIAHTVRQVVDDGVGDPDLHILQVDLVNAYNMADRLTTFREMEKLFPDCLSWVLTCYGEEAELVFGNTVINSSVGFHQGDPLASLLFSVNLQPIIETITTEVPGLKVNAWYLDDGTLADLQKAVDIILREGPARGLHLSTANTVLPPLLPKSTVWSPYDISDSDDPLDRGIPRVMDPGIVLLGSPIGDLQFTQEWIKRKVAKVKDITDHLPYLQDAHVEFVLLRSCLSLPKVMFILRTTYPTNN